MQEKRENEAGSQEEPQAKKAKLEAGAEEGVVARAARQAEALLAKEGKTVPAEWKHRMFYLSYESEEEDREVQCISGEHLSKDQYTLIVAMQYAIEEPLDGPSWMVAIASWFDNPKNCPSEDTEDSDSVDMPPYDKESYGCLYGKAVPFDPCQDYSVMVSTAELF